MAKTPQDHKKKQHPKSQKFEYTTDAGTISFPYVENIPMGVFEDVMDNPDQSAAVRTLLDGIMDEDSRELRRQMTFGEFQEMLDQWNEQSSLSLGES